MNSLTSGNKGRSVFISRMCIKSKFQVILRDVFLPLCLDNVDTFQSSQNTNRQQSKTRTKGPHASTNLQTHRLHDFIFVAFIHKRHSFASWNYTTICLPHCYHDICRPQCTSRKQNIRCLVVTRFTCYKDSAYTSSFSHSRVPE